MTATGGQTSEPTGAEMHPATLWEQLADRLGDVPAIIEPTRMRTWRELDVNAARLAGALAHAGVGPDDKVAVYLYNSAEFLESYFAAFKLRAQPVNVNYRYVEAELAYILDNADARALVFHSSLASRVAAIDTSAARPGRASARRRRCVARRCGAVGRRPGRGARRAAWCPQTRTTTTCSTPAAPLGSPRASSTRSVASPASSSRSGAPFLGASPPTTVEGAVELAVVARAADAGLVTLILPPLMHGTGMALAFLTLALGGTIVLTDPYRFDPVAALSAIEKHRVNAVSLVGDAFGRPLAAAMDAAADAGRPFDLSTVRLFMSSGAMLSAETKATLLRRAPGAMVIDTLAASEGSMGASISHAGSSAATATFAMRPGTKVLDDDDHEVAAGSGVTGRVAVAATNPIGYYKDPEKTAATFRVIDGVRYTFPGDWARVEVDGTITLLGRGSHCINTGGEKVYPEEVEEKLKTHAAVIDALVFGVEDPKWGQRIVATVSTSTPVDPGDLVEHVKAHLAAYKAPKDIHLVERVPRAANGKADYPEARRLAGHTADR